jgi:hypothetical protein
VAAELAASIAASRAAGQATLTYLRSRSLAAPLVLASTALREVRLGRGEPVIAMRAMVAATRRRTSTPRTPSATGSPSA